jgi:hypothetical protein
MSARSALRCELTNTYSPAAMDSAPGHQPVDTLKITTSEAPDAATPSTRRQDAVVAPSTAARRHWIGG